MKKSKLKKTVLFATLGHPGSGKTFLARRLANDFNLFHLNSDFLRLEMFPHPTYSAEESKAFFKVMDFLADELLSRGMSVIYDANSTRLEYRARLARIAKKRGAAYLLLWIRTPETHALTRLAKRKNLKSEHMKKYHRPVDRSVFEWIKKETEAPHRESFVEIDGMTAYNKQKAVILSFLKKRKLI